MVKYTITSRFQATEAFRDHPHTGVDLAMPEGTALKAIVEGVIRTADYGSSSTGKTVFIDAADGRTYIYGHLKDFSVSDGQSAHVGDILGHSGNTGHSTGPHLHFGIKEHGEFIDPTPYTSLIQRMDQLKGAAHATVNSGLDALEMLNQALSQFTQTLSEMTLNCISLLLENRTVSLISDIVLSWLC
ncbi:M23 family metallopeptidase [Bacillus subtilis]|uniref:M23 family metallopeptidase n=1 Tax=Bacillus subtilis TaxID=1423 RepID=UPI002DBA6F79|nr:M23 family metallopeptidase [Bacillus subtilis]MEC2236627.1 M23 family metallopeptidase [Bacillus subtilis]